ncbi:unnamed protein product [Echinostoma caproni]|uniref:SoHo domain-containing protein n=1 Tax=Echinostoma caproni TaxID=27848 RepID=A0A183B767_9TREM|nr:unnamed protein product [Echinostoma caproni]
MLNLSLSHQLGAYLDCFPFPVSFPEICCCQNNGEFRRIGPICDGEANGSITEKPKQDTMLQIKAGLQSTPAELIFGRTLHLPEEMVTQTSPTDFNYGEYADRLVYRMRQLHIQPPRQQTPLDYLPLD